LNFSISLIFAFVFYELHFVVAPVVLSDFCVVLKGKHFSYKNIQKKIANLILIHTPSFNINFEKFKQ